MAALVDPSPVAPDSSEPTGQDATGVGDPDLFRKLKLWTTNALDHLADWRKEADDAYDFYSGWQWSDDEKAIFEADGRVAPIFNLTAINVDAVCGLEVNNRQDVKYLPRTPGDVQVNELLSSAAMWVRDEAQSEDEESDAFKDAVITGLGVTESPKAYPQQLAYWLVLHWGAWTQAWLLLAWGMWGGGKRFVDHFGRGGGLLRVRRLAGPDFLDRGSRVR